MPDRDAAEFTEASYLHDPSADCDSLSDHVRELVQAHWKFGGDKKVYKHLNGLVLKVVNSLLAEGRMGGLVDLKKIPGKELLANLVAEMIAANDPLIMAKCIDFTFGLGVQTGVSQTAIGVECETTKATISRYCIYLKEVYLRGQPGPGMKPDAACKSYRAARLGRSSRGPRTDWAFGNVFKESYAAA